MANSRAGTNDLEETTGAALEFEILPRRLKIVMLCPGSSNRAPFCQTRILLARAAQASEA